MMIATLVIDGRYWYDFVTICVVIAFFAIECLLLFRNSIIGWLMTVKCLTLAGANFWALQHPPVVLPPENVTIDALLVRCWLIVVLAGVIAYLAYMRIKNLTVYVGRQGQQEDQAAVERRELAVTGREADMDVRDLAADARDVTVVGREGHVAGREGSVATREVAATDRETERTL